jgi:transposase-like protein
MRALVPQLQMSYRDLTAMMGERGIEPAHTTILRWVQQYTPEFQNTGTDSHVR